MDIDARYEFLEKVGSGSFATVYRARDLELGREVAIKQIHEQYLDDPKLLERYWQEAQLLASLHHPNIVTIFDVYKDRGWLILELMQSNLGERMAGRQMDLRALRTTIAHCLRALKYLHSRGIVHGDIKPSNMMIDARRRVKIGDFGLARRVSDEDGSLLKGTTKYMAPEVVSEEFGAIGPASDLYSLGFASYELMCGPNFETLFPGLSAFGRNKQIAWMMWHAAADRRLPDISRVLEGVPDDLRKVISGLCEKDQSKRYNTADDALSGLQIDIKVVNKGESEIEDSDEPAAMDPARKKKLLLAGAAMLASLVVCVMLFLLSSGEKPPRRVSTWMVTAVDRENRKLRVVDLKGDRAEYLEIGKNARITLEHNGEPEAVPFEDLKAGDRVEIEYIKGDGDSKRMVLKAARPILSRGRVSKIDLQESSIVFAMDDETSHESVTMRIPERMDVVLNLARRDWADKPEKTDREQLVRQYKLRISEVRPDDRVEVTHLPEVGGKRGRVITGVLFVHRVREVAGRIVEVDVPRKRLTLQTDLSRLNLPLNKECKITLENSGGSSASVTIDKLAKGDFVTAKIDTEFREIRATRGAGELTGAVVLVRDDKKELVVATGADARQETLTATDQTRVAINGGPATLADLRGGDRVTVILGTANGSQKAAATITAQRSARADRRVVLIGGRKFDDKSLVEVADATANVSLIRDVMLNRYAVEKDRLVSLDDPTAKEMRDSIADTLNRAGESVDVIIYISTHGFVVDGKVYLAGRKIDPQNIAGTGWALDDLLKQMEACPSKNKLLLLDLNHRWKDRPRADQLSTGEMMKLAATPLKSTTVIVANSGKEQGLIGSNGTHGVFATAVADGYRGPADADRNLRITPDELFADLSRRIKAVSLSAGKSQTPLRFPVN